MPIRHLINNDGNPFNADELHTLRIELDALHNDDRVRFRNDNAQAIAQLDATKVLIVSGPGTGKSTLFKQRINHWLQAGSSARILALSFVRKLVADLQNDIKGDRNLTDEQKKQTDVFTLHKFARSVVEKNHGSPRLRLGPHFRIIGQSWKEIIWKDVLLFVGQTDQAVYSWEEFEKQLHDSTFHNSPEWRELKDGYLTLCKFYNAAGFADLIIYAEAALQEDQSLDEHDFFIVDEYQDFNTSEKNLINQLTLQAQDMLVVGDDDQVLYEKLKSGKAELIRSLYGDTDFINAILPFCGRCSFHITKTASYFISQDPENGCIEKIYLPLANDDDCSKVQIIGCATPATAVDYIKKFVEDHQQEIEARRNDLVNGDTKDPFLLILTPAKELRFYANGNANQELLQLVSEFQQETKKFSEDYYKVLNFYSLANYPENNFTFRKVLAFEQVPNDNTVKLINKCLSEEINFCNLDDNAISSALARSNIIKLIIESSDTIEIKIENIGRELSLSDPEELKKDFENQIINEDYVAEIEHSEEEEAELDELEIQQMSAVELMTIVGSKGLSADHVIIVGFDNINMSWITKNAFYVAMTRARKSLHMITALASGGAQKPHVFSTKIPAQNVEFFKYTKTDRQKMPLDGLSNFNQYFDSLNYSRRRR